ncbi:MAG: oligopeptide/dipeptide ABC transporter ATP-binding protein [Candidatus Poriferisodalaceae bacterium]|jgi:oligopeptide/dipeptide ABC transporter ATP-binding protein
MAGSGTAHLRPENETLLRVEDLTMHFPGGGGRTVHAVSGISLDLAEGETLGLVGESGCGKSTTGKAILQVPSPTSGSISLGGVELTTLSPDAMRKIRPTLQMIFQDPISSLNPRRSVRDVVAEPLYVWWEEEEGRPIISTWFENYGRMFQRVAKLVTKPLRFVMPLASLAFVLWVISEAVEERSWEGALGWTQLPAQVIGFPVVAILGAISIVLLAMGGGWLLLAVMVPFGVVSRLFGEVSNTVGLIAAGFATVAAAWQTYATFDSFGGWARIANTFLLGLLTIILLLWTLAAVAKPARAGASGVAAGLAALLVLQVRYIASQDGTFWGKAGEGLWSLGNQRPGKLLLLVGAIVIDYFIYVKVRAALKRERQKLRDRAEPRVREVMETVGMNPDNSLDRKPYEFSGGQAQRISIARALIMDPKIIICDEPVSALDVSVQAQILNLLEDMKKRYGLTLVFIAHDLAVVKNVSDRVAVMYLGKLCEVADPDRLYEAPAHPYSELLLNAIPQPDPSVDPRVGDRVLGELPSPLDPPSGCRFRTRCPHATELCSQEEPQMRQIEEDHFVACHHPLIEVAQ